MNNGAINVGEGNVSVGSTTVNVNNYFGALPESSVTPGKRRVFHDEQEWLAPPRPSLIRNLTFQSQMSTRFSRAGIRRKRRSSQASTWWAISLDARMTSKGSTNCSKVLVVLSPFMDSEDSEKPPW